MSAHGGGLLDRPEDQPSESEERAVVRLKTDREKRLDEIDTAIARARHRQQEYLAKGDERSAEIEADVIDRRLRERLTA